MTTEPLLRMRSITKIFSGVVALDNIRLAGAPYYMAVDPAGRWGPYLQSPPVNPLTNSSSVSAGATALGAGGLTVGWVYNTQTGEIKGVTKLGAASDTGD